MNFKTLHKSLFCILTALFITLPSTAQDDLSGVYGTYTGTMPSKITKDGSTYDGTVKKVSFVISPEANGLASITMKDYAIYNGTLKDVLLSGNTIVKTADGWKISEGSSVQGDYGTRDNKFSITLTVRVHGGTVSPDGTCSLSLSVRYTDSTYEHMFRGSRATTGIRNVNSVLDVSRAVYDLQGRRVEKPGHGIYIVGGRKVIM